VVTSSAQNDAGLFELNLRDERYLCARRLDDGVVRRYGDGHHLGAG
jgi:hypothetical protein